MADSAGRSSVRLITSSKLLIPEFISYSLPVLVHGIFGAEFSVQGGADITAVASLPALLSSNRRNERGTRRKTDTTLALLFLQASAYFR